MKRKFTIILLAVWFLGVSCSIFPDVLKTAKSFPDMSPKEKATLFNKLYVAQYDDYLQMVAAGNLTDEQKQVLRAKKKVFVKIQPLLLEYSDYAATGILNTPGLEGEILKLLNELGAKVG